jgi:hypothetical protein
MHQGDREQLGHRKLAALRLRLTAIAAGDDTLHQHHQAGVLFSALADSAWWLDGSTRRNDANRLLVKAKVHFGTARERLGASQGLDHLALLIDEALLMARLYRLWNNEGYLTSAQAWADEAAGSLGDVATSPREKPDYWHLLAIATSVQMQLAWGLPLGYGGELDHVKAERLAAKAEELFLAERASSPDGERAYRSHLLLLALVHGKIGKKRSRRKLALQAGVSADTHKDRAHMLRATVIMGAGNFGDRQLRKLQDSRAISAS